MKELTMQAATQNERQVDCNATAAMRVKATSRGEAEKRVGDLTDAADGYGGAWTDGERFLLEASRNRDSLDLSEVARESGGEMRSRQTHVGELIGRIFVRYEPEDVDRVINRVMTVHPEAHAADESFECQMRGVGCLGDTAIVRQEFASASAYSVRGVQRLLSVALAADGVRNWPDGTAAVQLTGAH